MSTLTPNMNLVIPSVGTTSGPDYALQTNQSLTLVDQHDHTPGKGVQITPAGINVNTDFLFNGYAATGLKSLTLVPQGSLTDINALYDIAGDLFFNDGVGNVIRITQSGGIAGTPGSISGLVAPASATYVPISSTFVFQSNVNTAANIDAGSYLLRNLTPNSTFAVTLSPPSGLSSNSTITLPVIPPTTSFMTMDNAGQMLVSQVYPLTAPGLQTDSVTTPKIQNAAVTRPKLAPVGQQKAATSGLYTTSVTTVPTLMPNQTVTITTTGRPVIVMMQSDDTGNAAFIGISTNVSAQLSVYFRRDSTVLNTNSYLLQYAPSITNQGTGASTVPYNDGSNLTTVISNLSGITAGGSVTTRVAPSLVYLDAPAAGTYTYTIYANASISGTGQCAFANIQLVVYELA